MANYCPRLRYPFSFVKKILNNSHKKTMQANSVVYTHVDTEEDVGQTTTNTTKSVITSLSDIHTTCICCGAKMGICCGMKMGTSTTDHTFNCPKTPKCQYCNARTDRGTRSHPFKCPMTPKCTYCGKRTDYGHTCR